jgi:hypothetical protein
MPMMGMPVLMKVNKSLDTHQPHQWTTAVMGTQ